MRISLLSVSVAAVVAFMAARDYEVYDIAGRVVSSRSLGVMEKGWRKVAIEARDASGALLPSGVYFYRVRAGAETVTNKMVIAR